MWAFYRNESDQWASKLSSLHDTSASLRHQLHRKLGGAVLEEPLGNNAAAAASAANHNGAGGGPIGIPPASTSGAVSLLDDAHLQYSSSSSPTVSTGGVLRPTPQVGQVLGVAW